MSLRWFVYYCSLYGGCGAYIGRALGRLPLSQSSLGQACVRGLFLGLVLALVLTIVDAIWNLSNQGVEAGWRVFVGGLVGGMGGFVGGALGQLLYGKTQWALFLVLGWALTGMLIGAAPGMFEFFAGLLRNQSNRGPTRKLFNGVLGGAMGGLVGGGLFLILRGGWGLLLRERADELGRPGATGFVALGLCIGLLIGLAQVILKEAWVRVEVGFRAGRELILTKADTTIGKDESCDVGLFGDPGVERIHARISFKDGRYVLEDASADGGTYLNGERIDRPTPLNSGDEVRLGRSVLRFGERQRRED